MITKEINNIKVCYHKLSGKPISKNEFNALSRIYNILLSKIHLTDIEKVNIVINDHIVNIKVIQNLKEENDIIDYFINRYSKMNGSLKFISYKNETIGRYPTVSVMSFEFPLNLMLRLLYR